MVFFALASTHSMTGRALVHFAGTGMPNSVNLFNDLLECGFFVAIDI